MNTSKNTVLLAGATGLVGKQCLGLLLESPAVESVIPVVRRPLAENIPPIQPLVTDFSALDSMPPATADVALCAIGTTIKQAGSKQGFRQVDFEAVIQFARFAARSEAKTFGLVSSIGAAATSRNFYLRVKGEAEEAVAALGFRSFVALRPSLLLGTRAEFRMGEAFSQAFSPFLSPLLQGSTKRFRPIESKIVARALASLAVSPPLDGQQVWQYDEIKAASSQNDI